MFTIFFNDLTQEDFRGSAAQERANHLIFRTTSNNKCWWSFELPLCSSIHCDVYAKSMFITVYSCSEHSNQSVHL